MNDISRVILDVASLLTCGSDAARIEARRIASERECRAAANFRSLANPPSAATAIALHLGWLRGAWTRPFSS